MKVSIIIPTKNGGSLFEEVLRGIRGQRFEGNVELLIVDSGSTDNTVVLAKKYGARVLEIPPKEFNHGLTRNYGIENSSGEIIVLITQDAVPEGPLWLKSLVDTFYLDEKIAGVYARQIPRPDADALTKRNLNSWLTGGTEYRVQEIRSREEFKRLSPVERYFSCVFDNVCSALRRTAWKEFPFRKNDFGEDIEWAKRVLLGKWKIAYQPKAAVVHSHSRSFAYEFKRTYMCHRKLYELFDLRALSSISTLMKSAIYEIKRDVTYVLKHEHGISKKFAMASKVPFIDFAVAYAQYLGAKDEMRAGGIKMEGV